MKKIIKKYYLGFIIILSAFIVDFITKIIATNSLKYVLASDGNLISSEPSVIIKGFFNFTYAQNKGGGWSIFSGNMVFFYIVTIIAIGIFVYLLKDFDLKTKPWFYVGVCLMFGGTLGNFYDRIFKGFVVDFLDFNIFGYDYPIFNMADVFLVIGAISIVISILLDMRKQKDDK